MATNRRKRKALTLDQIRKSMSTAIRELETIYMDTENDTDKRIRAINSLASTVNAYSRLTELHSIEERITKLEKLMENNNGTFRKAYSKN
jgi:hypothetical protein